MRLSRHEKKALEYLLTGETESLANMPGVGQQTMDSLVANGWAEPHRDAFYRVEGYRITEAGASRWEQSTRGR